MTASLHISEHPIVGIKLSQLREAANSPKVVRELMRDLSLLLGYEASSCLPILREKKVCVDGNVVLRMLTIACIS